VPRILGIDIPSKKRLMISLTYIFGVGPHVASEVCDKLRFDPNMDAGNLTEEEVARIASLLQSDYRVEGDLRREVQNSVKRLISINCYRGQRHRAGLPVRGQRTHTNCRTGTRKGRSRSVVKKKK